MLLAIRLKIAASHAADLAAKLGLKQEELPAIDAEVDALTEDGKKTGKPA